MPFEEMYNCSIYQQSLVLIFADFLIADGRGYECSECDDDYYENYKNINRKKRIRKKSKTANVVLTKD